MAIKGNKRPAAATVAARKRARTDGSDTRAKCTLISKALHLADVPSAVSTMLANSVLCSVGVYADVRHEHQSSLTEMIGKTLEGVDTALEKRKAEASQNVEAHEAAKVTLADTYLAAVENLEVQKGVHAQAKAALEESAAAVTDAKHALSAAQAAQTACIAHLTAATARKEKLDAATAKLLAMKDAKGAAADARSIQAMAKETSCEVVLVKAIPMALKKGPAERGTFDNFVMSQLETGFSVATEDAAKILANAEPNNASHAKAVDQARATSDAAVEKHASGKEVVRQAAESEKQKEVALKEATHSRKACTKEQNDMAKSFGVASDDLDKFRKGVLAAFKELSVRTTPVPATDEHEASHGSAADAPTEPRADVTSEAPADAPTKPPADATSEAPADAATVPPADVTSETAAGAS